MQHQPRHTPPMPPPQRRIDTHVGSSSNSSLACQTGGKKKFIAPRFRLSDEVAPLTPNLVAPIYGTCHVPLPRTHGKQGEKT